MTDNIIKFHSCHKLNNESEDYRPSPVKNHIPNWFLEKDKHVRNEDGTYPLIFLKGENGNTVPSRMPSWKSCPALLDVFVSGYYLFTPCDITIKTNHENPEKQPVTVKLGGAWSRDDANQIKGFAFCKLRGDEEGLPKPDGYYEIPYTWVLNWSAQVPKGYTIFLTSPINIPNLPFKTMSGFMDSYSILTGSGNIPVYFKEGWEGTIPAGTPYAQLIPIKNESWESEIVEYTDEEIKENFNQYVEDYMLGFGITSYKGKDWSKKRYT
jgi:hypothetical protein